MSESLDATCGQFEQVILGQMLHTAGIGRHESPPASDDDTADYGTTASPEGDDAFSQLIVQSLAGAIERAGGIGLKSSLMDALEGRKQ
ncbi:MAG TPA: hypothetical protein VFO25_06030 [Candidatus Eremiobacteraceae bacterium]|nr:hypothetical protein [Candidatus Eremiobacteraceae bacterium]